MKRRKKTFGCITFKDEMQRLAEERMTGLSPEERRRRRLEEIESGAMGEWWRRVATRRRGKGDGAGSG